MMAGAKVREVIDGIYEKRPDAKVVVMGDLNDDPNNKSVKSELRAVANKKKMEKALQEDNLEELARLAHWLKGSAGSVGFDSFTQPAADLETYARNGKPGLARICLQGIREMNQRIVTREPEPASPSGKDSQRSLSSGRVVSTQYSSV